MASSTPNIIVLQVNGGDRPIFEKPSSAAVTPGTLLTIAATTVAENATAARAGNFLRAVAVENPYAPIPTASAISQDYASGDTVRFVYPEPGDMMYLWLKSGANVAYGATLETATGGELQATTTGSVVCVAEEAVNASGGALRIRVRFV
jgi:hypothetical protein